MRLDACDPWLACRNTTAQASRVRADASAALSACPISRLLREPPAADTARVAASTPFDRPRARDRSPSEMPPDSRHTTSRSADISASSCRRALHRANATASSCRPAPERPRAQLRDTQNVAMMTPGWSPRSRSALSSRIKGVGALDGNAVDRAAGVARQHARRRLGRRLRSRRGHRRRSPAQPACNGDGVSVSRRCDALTSVTW